MVQANYFAAQYNAGSALANPSQSFLRSGYHGQPHRLVDAMRWPPLPCPEQALSTVSDLSQRLEH